MNGAVERVVGAPAVFEELKHRPGRRLTMRARGPEGSAIVKLYCSHGVLTVAERILALADGPPEPELPELLAVDPGARLLVLSDVPGSSLGDAVRASDEAACRRAGAGIAGWHSAWAGSSPHPLREHTIEPELDALIDQAAHAGTQVGRRVAASLTDLRRRWRPATVVHGDLSEERVLLGERVGLIALDDAALGPPELDVGNLLAHLDLLELCSRRGVERGQAALLDGYAGCASLDARLLEGCRTLAQLRLASSHDEPRQVGREAVSTAARL